MSPRKSPGNPLVAKVVERMEAAGFAFAYRPTHMRRLRHHGGLEDDFLLSPENYDCPNVTFSGDAKGPTGCRPLYEHVTLGFPLRDLAAAEIHVISTESVKDVLRMPDIVLSTGRKLGGGRDSRRDRWLAVLPAP